MAKRKRYDSTLAEIADALANTKAAENLTNRVGDLLERIFGPEGKTGYDAGREAFERWKKQADDPYREIGVAPEASEEVIRAAYKAEARRRHPDKGGSQEEMQRLNTAFAKIKEERGIK